MAKLYGDQNPSKCVFLVDEEKTTEYEETIQLYKAAGYDAFEWQIDLLKHLMAKNDDGLWVHTKFGYSIPRRNGKSELMIMRILYGLEHAEDILYTAHRTTTSHSFYERVCDALDKMGYVKASEVRKNDDIPKDKIYDAYKANGLESITLRKNKGRISFRTRTSKGGLGEKKDLLLHDEAQELQDDQESSLKYIVSDSKNPQTIMCGTPPTAVSSGTVFVNYRNRCLEGKAKNSAWAEWSVDTMTDVYDESAWIRANPSLGYVFSERAIEDEIGTDDVDFNIQRLGLWLKYNQKSEISENTWNALKVDKLPKFKGQLHVGIKFGIDGKNIALAVAVKTDTDKVFVEVIDVRPTIKGLMWLAEFLQKSDYRQCVCDGKGGQQMMEDLCKELKLKNVKFPTVDEVIAANAMFEQSLNDGTLCHNGQYILSDVVTNCARRNIGTRGGFGYSSLIDGVDIATMDAVIFAFWSCFTTKERKPQKVSY